MLNIQKKFERLEKMQRTANDKLDKIELKFDKGDFVFNPEFDQYKLQSDLEELMKDDKEKEIDRNYLKLYNDITKYKSNKELNKFNPKNNPKRIGNNNLSLPDQNIPIKKKEFCEIGIETDKRMVLQYENKNQQKLQLGKINKNVLHKKQNNFLTNELVNMKLKLNKMNNKNKILDNILTNQKSVKNYKLLEKIISGFIEQLAVNWTDVVDLLIDDLLNQEIYNLNEIELEKINTLNRNSKSELYTANESNALHLNENESSSNLKSADKESLYEINKLISEYRREEELLMSKYNIK